MKNKRDTRTIALNDRMLLTCSIFLLAIAGALFAGVCCAG